MSGKGDKPATSTSRAAHTNEGKPLSPATARGTFTSSREGADRESGLGSAPLVEGEDYEFENGLMVFTAAYHLKRGSCCGSGCRHCPYRGGPNERR